MALKCRGVESRLNFGLGEYEDLLPMLPNLSKVGLLTLVSQDHRPPWQNPSLEHRTIVCCICGSSPCLPGALPTST